MTVLFRPYGDILRAPAPRDAHDIVFCELLGARLGRFIEHDENVDYEGWMEPACMLDTALGLGLEVKILPPLPLVEAVASPLHVIPGKPCRDVLLGWRMEADPHDLRHFDLGWPSASEHLATRYAELEAFTRNAGRRVQLADVPGDPGRDAQPELGFATPATSAALGDALASFAGTAVFVKHLRPAHALPMIRFDLDKDIASDEARDLFLDHVGPRVARYAGDRGALLVQEEVYMSYETRFFVIDGELICGAPRVESDTPRQAPYPGILLPRRWETLRNSGVMDRRPKIDQMMTARELWAFARKVSDEIHEEAPELKHYVLDVALGADLKPLVVDLAPPADRGLYALDTDLLLEAIMRSAKQEPHRKPEPVEKM